MDRGRLEAFSDGVIAILITIMVLELRAPQGSDWRALEPIIPTLLLYATGIPVAFFGHPWVAGTLYVLVALLWLAPDPRIETRLKE